MDKLLTMGYVELAPGTFSCQPIDLPWLTHVNARSIVSIISFVSYHWFFFFVGGGGITLKLYTALHRWWKGDFPDIMETRGMHRVLVWGFPWQNLRSGTVDFVISNIPNCTSVHSADWATTFHVLIYLNAFLLKYAKQKAMKLGETLQYLDCSMQSSIYEHALCPPEIIFLDNNNNNNNHRSLSIIPPIFGLAHSL